MSQENSGAGTVSWVPLVAPRFVSPLWFSRGAAGVRPGVVTPEGKVSVCQMDLAFRGEGFPEGTQLSVEIGPDGGYRACKTAELENHKTLERQRADATDREEHRQRLAADQEKRRLGLEFNAKLQLGVRWSPAVKEVLSGLSERSCGTATTRRTVVHILVEEPVAVGRLRRGAGAFLCSPVRSKWGGDWTGTNGRLTPDARVTCERCLRIAARAAGNEQTERRS